MSKAKTVKYNFTKVGGLGSATTMGNKKGELPTIIGWVIKMKTIEKEYREKKKKVLRYSHIFTLALPNGGRQDIWGGGSINNVLVDDAGEKKAKLKKEFQNVLCEFKYVGMLKAKPGQNPGRNIEIGADRSVKLPTGAGRIEF